MENNLNLESFIPKVAELNALAEKSRAIVSVDAKDRTQLASIRSVRIELKNARVQISKTGRELREQTNAFNKAVLSKEKELIAIIDPEEMRLERIEESAEEALLMEERRSKLPERKKRLDDIGHGDIDQDAVCEMDDVVFESFFNAKVEINNRRESERIATERQKIEDDKAMVEAEKQKIENNERRKRDLAEAEERGRKDAEQKAKDEAARIEREKQDREEREKAEKKAADRKLAKDAEFIAFLKKMGVTKETPKSDYIVQQTETEYVLFVKKGVLKK